MSFDLAVWHEPSGITAEQAANRYSQLIEVKPGASTSPTHPQVEAFYQQLTSHYPELDNLTDDDIDHSPWSTRLTMTDTAVLMSVSWSGVDEAAPFVRKLADQHGLVVCDPQQDTVHHPSAMRSAPALVLSSCDGSQIDDPDHARIRRTLQRLSPANWFAVLERGHSYIQVGYGEQAATRPGWYALERREGSADQHFRTEVTDLNEVIAAFVGYAEGDDSWRQRFDWRKVDL